MNNDHNGNGKDPDEQTEDNDDNIIRIPTLAERDKMRRKAEKQARKDYRASHPHEPMINLPTVTKIMIALLIIPHLITHYAISPPLQYWITEHFAFTPAAYTTAFSGWPAFISPFTHMFLHASWFHIGVNTVMLIAFGAGLERWMGGVRMFVFFYICALAAALFHFIIGPTNTGMMIGASGGVSGMFGAVMVMLQSQNRMPLGKYGLWPFVIFWIALSFVFGVIGSPDGSDIAWAAHIGGFLFGFLMIKPFMKRF